MSQSPMMPSVYIMVRKTQPDAKRRVDPQALAEEILDAFGLELALIESCWTPIVRERVLIESEQNLIERGILSAGHRTSSEQAYSREKLVADGYYAVSIVEASAAFTADPVPSHRPSSADSIEEAVGRAFAMQLDRTLAVLGAKAVEAPAKGAQHLRDALYQHVAPGLQLNKKSGGGSDRSGRANEQLKRIAKAGRDDFETLFAGKAEAAVERLPPSTNFTKRLNLRDLLSEDRSFVLQSVTDELVRRELAILFILADLRKLSRAIHAAQIATRQAIKGPSLFGRLVKEILRILRYPQSTAHQIVEAPHLTLPSLEELAEHAFHDPDATKAYGLSMVLIELGQRYEVDLLELIPSRQTLRPIVHAAIARAACRRRGILPDLSTQHGYLSYWGLRAVLNLDNEPRLHPLRQPFRTLLRDFPQALVDFACSDEGPNFEFADMKFYTN